MKKTEMRRRAKTQDAIQIMERMMEGDLEARRAVEGARVNVAVAQLLYRARQKAGLTQKELAVRIGTKQPVIARLEDADYEGHSLSMLQRVAAALNQRVEIKLKPLTEKEAA